jgi:hypothetical protein
MLERLWFVLAILYCFAGFFVLVRRNVAKLRGEIDFWEIGNRHVLLEQTNGDENPELSQVPNFINSATD